METGKQRKIGWKNRRAVWSGSLLIGMAMASAALQAQSVSFTGIQTTVLSHVAAQAVAVDGSGNVFVADSVSGSVVKVPPTGSSTTVASGYKKLSGVAVDGAGNVFVADASLTSVVKIPSGGGTPLSVGSGLSQPRGVAVDKTGNVFVADTGNSCVVRIANGTQSVLPFSGLSSPYGVAADGAGNVLVADTGNGRVMKIPSGGGTPTTVASGLDQPTGVAVDEDGNVFAAEPFAGSVVKIPSGGGTPIPVGSGLSQPPGVAVDGAGNVYVADLGTDLRVVKVQLTPNFGNVNIGSNATLSLPYQVEANTTLGTPQVLTDGAPNLDFTLDSSTCSGSLTAGSSCTVNVIFTPRFAGLRRGAVQMVDASGTVLATTFVQGIGVGPQIAFGSSAQITVSSGFSEPTAVAVDGAGNLFVVEYHNNGLVKVTPGGTPTTVASGFTNPEGVAVDGAGNVLVADTQGNQVVKIAPDGAQATVGSGYHRPYSVTVDGAGDVFVADSDDNSVVKVMPDGTQTTVGSGFNHPAAVAVDGVGDVFVADRGNHQVVKVMPDGAQTTVGSGFNDPAAVAVDGAGDVFVVDHGNFQVVKVAPDGTQTTVGSGFNNPGSVAVDGAGDVFVADSDNNRVVELPRSQPPALTFAATTVGSTSADSPQSFTVENIGNAPLNGSGLTVTGNFAQVTGPGTPADCTASFSLTPGESCHVSVSFTPTASGPLTGSLVLTDNALNASATQTVSLSGVGQAISQTITFNPIASPQAVGTTVALSATASSGLTVSFTSLTSNVCTVSGATATPVNGGTCAIKASQGGNAQYAAATPVTQNFTVLKPQVITFSPIPQGTVGTSVTLHATSSPGSGIPITFSSTTPAVCSIAGNTATLLTVGTCSIQASQAGNSLYAPANPVAQSFTVAQKTQTITFTGLPATATYGSAGPYTLNATASSGLPVNYSVTGPASLSGSTLTVTGAGTITVTASQAGNATYAAASSVTQTLIVTAASQSITFTGLPGTAVYGSAGPYTLNGTASSGLPVTYSVTGPATIAGSTLTITGAGTVTVTASQAGNANYKAAPSVTQTVVVSGASQSITFGTIPPQVVGTTLPLSATASSGLPVSFTSLTPNVCTVSGATATLAAPGTCTIQASQPGNGQYAAAAPITQSFTVSSAAGFTITPEPGSETIKRGVLAGFLLQLKSVNGFHGSVKLTCSGGPAGSYCADLPQTVQVNGTAYAVSGILFPKNTTPGTYTITFTGVSGSLANTATAKFTVLE